MNLWAKVKFFFLLKIRRTCKTALGQIFGVIPEYQGKGIEGGIIMSFANVALQKGFQYTFLEMNWIGDFNPVMMRMELLENTVNLFGTRNQKLGTRN